MEITIAAIQCEVSESIKDYAREKFGKLERYFDRARTTEVAIHAERGNYSVELNIWASNGRSFSVHVTTEESIEEAIDLANDKMAKQLRRYKDKLKGRRQRGGRDKLVRDIKRVTQRLEAIVEAGEDDIDLRAALDDALVMDDDSDDDDN